MRKFPDESHMVMIMKIDNSLFAIVSFYGQAINVLIELVEDYSECIKDGLYECKILSPSFIEYFRRYT